MNASTSNSIKKSKLFEKSWVETGVKIRKNYQGSFGPSMSYF